MGQGDCDVDGGAHSALTAAVLKVGMPLCPHRKVQRDASAKRSRSRVQRASEAPDGDTTTYPGYDARRACAEGETARKSLLLQVQMEFWDAAGPRDRLNFKT